MNLCYSSNEILINSLQTTQKAKQLMKKVDRGYFCIDDRSAYCDKPQRILMNQTISAPHMHAKALEYLSPNLKPGSTVLDVGSGSGYLTACFGEAVKVYHPNHTLRGKVIGLEYYQPLVTYSIKRTNTYLPHLFTYPSRYQIIHGSGWEGYPAYSEKEIYDAIHVGASCDSIPIYLVYQLKKNGRMVLPLKMNESESHIFCILRKTKKGNIVIRQMDYVRYVPLLK